MGDTLTDQMRTVQMTSSLRSGWRGPTAPAGRPLFCKLRHEAHFNPVISLLAVMHAHS